MAGVTARCPMLQRGDLYPVTALFVQFFCCLIYCLKTVLSTINGLLPV